MAARSVPFLFRINSEQEGHGIMYKAVEELNPNLYSCVGTSNVGMTSDDQPIWLFGRYMDDMPTVSMHEVISDDDVQKMSAKETRAFVKKNKLAANLNHAELFSDGKSFWFVEASGRLNKKARKSRKMTRKPRKLKKPTRRST
jgi:hypothetical protein